MDVAFASSWWSTIPGDCGVGHVDHSTRGPVEHRGCSGLCQVSPPGLVAHLGRTSIRGSCAGRTVGHRRFKIHPAARLGGVGYQGVLGRIEE